MDIKVYATGLLLLMGVKWGDEFIHSFAFLFSHFGTLNWWWWHRWHTATLSITRWLYCRIRNLAVFIFYYDFLLGSGATVPRTSSLNRKFKQFWKFTNVENDFRFSKQMEHTHFHSFKLFTFFASVQIRKILIIPFRNGIPNGPWTYTEKKTKHTT